MSGALVALLVFKTSVGLNKVSGGFDSHPPPPIFWFVDMAGRIAQPPVDPSLRPTEARGFWPGLILATAAVLLLAIGWRLPSAIATSDGERATQFQLVKAFTCSGLEAKSSVTMPDLASYDDPAEAEAALQRMAEQKASSFPIKYTVNTGSADPCPT